MTPQDLGIRALTINKSSEKVAADLDLDQLPKSSYYLVSIDPSDNGWYSVQEISDDQFSRLKLVEGYLQCPDDENVSDEAEAILEEIEGARVLHTGNAHNASDSYAIARGQLQDTFTELGIVESVIFMQIV